MQPRLRPLPRRLPRQVLALCLHQDCLAMADYVAKDFMNEIRSELPLTPGGMEHHLRLHNANCDHLVEMLTATLLRAGIPDSEKHTLGLLSKICQHNVLETWPGARLRRQATTRIPRSFMGEFAEFETRRLDFMTETRETLLEVFENLYHPERAATANHLLQCRHILD